MKKFLSAALALAMGISCTSLVACGKKDGEVVLTDAQIAEKVISGVRAMYIEKYSNTETPSDYNVVGQYPYEGVYYTLSWSVNVTEGVTVSAMDTTTKKVTIDVNEKTPTEINYELTASVKVNETSDSITFKGLKVPAYSEDYTTHAEYAAAAKDTVVRVHGIVTGIASKSGTGAQRNCVYFEDKDGGYYAYNMESLPEGLALGDEIVVTGKIDNYQNANQVVSATAVILSKGNTVTPTDITEKVKAAKDNKDESLLALTQQLVTIKGVMLHNNTTDATYYPFKLSNVDSYIRISTSDCPTNKDNQAAVQKAHADNLGKIATVTGIAVQYGKAFYLVPVGADAYKDFTDNNLTDAEKIAEAKKSVATLIETTYSEVKNDIPLPTESWGATLAWSVDDGKGLVSVEGNKLNILARPETADTKVTLKVSISCGNETPEVAEVEITVTAKVTIVHAGTADDPYTIQEVKAKFASYTGSDIYKEDGVSVKVYVKGYVTDIGRTYVPKDQTTGNLSSVYIADTSYASKEDSFMSYDLLWDTELYGEFVKDKSPFTLGDELVIGGYIKKYNGNAQLVRDGNDYPAVTQWNKVSEAPKGTDPNPYTIAEAKTALASVASGGMYQVNGVNAKVYIKGYVTDIGKTYVPSGQTTGNLSSVYIGDSKDATKENSFLIYDLLWDTELYGEFVKDKSPFTVGDEIVVCGYIKNFHNNNNNTDTLEMVKDGTDYPNVLYWVKAPKEGELKATIAYSGTTTGNMSGENDANSVFGLDASIFEIKSEKTNNGNNHVGLNKDGNLRLYKNQTATLHINVATGYVIDKIEVILVDNSPKKFESLVVTVNGQSVSGSNGAYAVNGASVSLHNSNNDSSNNQIYIASIVISYSKV